MRENIVPSRTGRARGAPPVAGAGSDYCTLVPVLYTPVPSCSPVPRTLYCTVFHCTLCTAAHHIEQPQRAWPSSNIIIRTMEQ